MYVVERVRITDRDCKLLEFAAQHRIVLADQVQALLHISAQVASGRMGALARAGMLGSQALFDRRPRCYWITRRGLQAIGSELPTPRLDLRAYQHDVGVAWLWLAARRGAFGPLDQLVSERRMRSQDAAEAHSARILGENDEPWAVRLGGLGVSGRARLHYPDLLLLGPDGRRVAVELELTSKTRARRERILAGYGADRRIDAVLYLVDRPGVGRAVRASADRLGISRRVHVQPVRWPASNATAAIRVAERAAERVR
jgi:hypothetical protein